MNKKIRRYACILSMTAVLSLNTVGAQEMIKLPAEVSQTEMQEVKLTIGKMDYKVDENVKTLVMAPYIKGDTAFLPLDFATELVGISEDNVEWNEKNNIVTLFKGNSIVQITKGNKKLIVDGNKIDLGEAPEVKGDCMMVPYKVIEEISDRDMKWNSLTKIITIFVEKQKKEEVVTWDYTYEDLLNKALDSSKDLEKSKASVDRADYVKDDANDAIDYSPIGTGNGASDAQTDRAYINYKSSEISLEKSKKNVETVKEMIAYRLKNAYYDVLKKEDIKEVAKLQSELKNENKKHAKLKYELGVASELQNKQAIRDFEDAKKGYDLAIKELEKSYQTLNDLVGFDVYERYRLKDTISFEIIADEDVDSHILGAINESPEIWGAERNKELAGLGVKFYTFNSGATPYEAKKIDVKTAGIELNSIKQAYEKNLRACYNSLKQLEDQYQKDEIAYEKSKDDLEIVKLQLEIGNAAPIDVKKINLQLESTKKQLRDRIMSYNMLAMQYNKPWLN